jgi:hypothetical protein
MEKDEETRRTGGMLRKARLAAAAAGAAVLAGFARSPPSGRGSTTPRVHH